MKTKVEKITADLAINAEVTEVTEAKLKRTVARQKETQQRYDSLRVERQTLLASSSAATDITAKLKLAEESIELADDAVTGVNNELLMLASEREKLLADHGAAVLEQDTEELKTLAGIYNEQAAQLAKTVREIWLTRLRLKESRNHSNVLQPVVGWGRNALECIPKFYFAGETPPANPAMVSFFDANLIHLH